MNYRRYTPESIKGIEDSIKGYEFGLNGFRDEIAQYEEQSPARKYLVDAILFHILFGYDVAVLYKNFMAAKTPFEQRMISRLIASLLYEFMEDSFEVMGKDMFRNVSSALNNFNKKEELKDLKDKLNNFKEKYFSKFQTIRNIAGAHRDKNPYLQLEVVEQIVTEETEYSVKDFLRINGELYRYYFNLLARITKEEK